MNSLSACPDAGLKRLCERLNADKVKCIPGALNLFRPAHKACEAGRVFSPSRRDTAPMMLKHVGESLQRPRSQLLHQILHFWIQHPVLGKMALFLLRLTLRLSHVQFGYYHVLWPIGRKAPIITASYRGTVISQVRVHTQIIHAWLWFCWTSNVRIKAAAAHLSTES